MCSSMGYNPSAPAFNTSGYGTGTMIGNAKAALWTDPQGFLTSTNYSLYA